MFTPLTTKITVNFSTNVNVLKLYMKQPIDPYQSKVYKIII